MGLVLAGLFTLALVLVALWLFSLINSLRLDRRTALIRAQDETKRIEQTAREARLYTQGEPLRCMGCGTAFPGPLPDTGCPKCNLAALVVTEADYQSRQILENDVPERGTLSAALPKPTTGEGRE